MAHGGSPTLTYQGHPFGELPDPRTKEIAKVTITLPRENQPSDPVFHVFHKPNDLHDIRVGQLVQKTELVNKPLKGF